MTTAIKSPLAGHAFTPTKLPAPAREHNLVFTLRPSRNCNKFETQAECRAEDLLRASCLLKSQLPEAKTFGAWLRGATGKGRLPLTPASSVYLGHARYRLLGVLHQSLAPCGGTPSGLVAFTLIHPKWYYLSGQLHTADLKTIGKQLQGYLRRAGVVDADGVLFAAVHGEFDGKGYQIHFHGIASEDKARLIPTLAGRFGFEATTSVKRPVQCSKVDDLPGWMSYCLKSYWPYRPYFINETGDRRRGKKQRLPAAQHVEVLLWMARQHLFSMTVRSGFSPFSRGTVGTAE